MGRPLAARQESRPRDLLHLATAVEVASATHQFVEANRLPERPEQPENPAAEHADSEWNRDRSVLFAQSPFGHDVEQGLFVEQRFFGGLFEWRLHPQSLTARTTNSTVHCEANGDRRNERQPSRHDAGAFAMVEHGPELGVHGFLVRTTQIISPPIPETHAPSAAMTKQNMRTIRYGSCSCLPNSSSIAQKSCKPSGGIATIAPSTTKTHPAIRTPGV